ncbi:MAG TPA: MraY family glycosyltransferase [Thermoleophilaceae bacterium]|nr:MraY family glycosyltransferase [Thermoleophilaceae bacterium]
MNELDAVWALVVAALVALAATPLAARIAHRVGAVDTPTERGLHDRPMPYLGGLAILAGVLVAGLLFIPGGGEVRGILAGAAAIAIVGAVDDALDLSPGPKLAGQIVAAIIPVAAGVRVEEISIPLIGTLDLGGAGPVLTVVGIVAVMNVVNFTDGVDGLAAGVCMIAAATLAVIALSLAAAALDPTSEGAVDRFSAGVLAAATAGAAAGFLRHNFHPASIFMGDSGSNLLGLLLACVAVQGVLKTAAFVALVFPLAVLAVPILDSGFVIAKRLKHRRPVYEADRWHFHHRFANIGFSQRRTVVYLYGWTLSLAALALALRFVPYSDGAGDFYAGWTAVMVGFGLVAVAASVYLVYVLEILKFRRFRSRQLRREAVAHGEAPPPEDEIEAEVEREVETGEFEALGGAEGGDLDRPETGEYEAVGRR